MNTFIHPFDDLPLVIENGFEGLEVSGSAEISYTRDGEWSVEEIFCDCRRRIHHSIDAIMAAAAAGVFLKHSESKSVPLDRGTPLFTIINDRLESGFSDVQEAVREQLASDYEDAMEARADMRRDHMMGL